MISRLSGGIPFTFYRVPLTLRRERRRVRRWGREISFLPPFSLSLPLFPFARSLREAYCRQPLNCQNIRLLLGFTTNTVFAYRILRSVFFLFSLRSDKSGDNTVTRYYRTPPLHPPLNRYLAPDRDLIVQEWGGCPLLAPLFPFLRPILYFQFSQFPSSPLPSPLTQQPAVELAKDLQRRPELI